MIRGQNLSRNEATVATIVICYFASKSNKEIYKELLFIVQKLFSIAIWGFVAFHGHIVHKLRKRRSYNKTTKTNGSLSSS